MSDAKLKACIPEEYKLQLEPYQIENKIIWIGGIVWSSIHYSIAGKGGIEVREYTPLNWNRRSTGGQHDEQ